VIMLYIKTKSNFMLAENQFSWTLGREREWGGAQWLDKRVGRFKE